MRKLILLGVLLALVGGCKKIKIGANNPPPQAVQTQPVQPQPNQDQPKVHAPTGVVVNQGGGGGGGGAAQQVRKAAKRAANQNNLNQLRTFIEAMIIDERMPTRQQVTDDLRRTAANLYKDLDDGVLSMPEKLTINGIWVYTVEPQTYDNEFLVVTRGNSIGKMKKAELDQALAAQK